MGGESVPGQDKPFNALFQEHLERGTRADQRADDPSRRKWKHADFASQIAVDQRSVTNWKNGSRTPLKPEFDKIVALLFGDNPLHTAAKAAFIAAWQTADKQRGGAREALPKTLIPSRQAGPYFGIGPDMRLRQEQAPELDAAGNNLRRIAEQLPLVREAMEDLAERIGPNNNAFPELVRILARYRSAIAGNEPISWGLVWGLGVRLEEAAAAAERQIDRMAPTLEDAAHAALQAWRSLHAPLILATAEGRELQEQADQLRMTRAEQAALREDAEAVAEALRRADDISEPETAEAVAQAANAIGQGRHPERGTVFGIATIKNTAIVLVGAAVVAAPTALVGGVAGVGATMAAWEIAKHTPFYISALKALGADMHRLIERGGPETERLLHRLAPFRAFVRANEAPLRHIAGNTSQLRWMTAYIDLIVRTDAEQRGGRADTVPGTDSPTKPAAPAKPDWASAVGTDQYGTYAIVDFHGERGAAVTQRLRWISPGRFVMGSPDDEAGRDDDEGPLHLVTLGQGFWLFDTPCTQALWRAVMGRNPSRFKSPTRPVESVSFVDVQRFLDRLNDRAPGLDLVLPSEAQWEYACRAGTRAATYAGKMEILGANNAPVLDAIAWYGGNSGVGFELKNGVDISSWPERQYEDASAGTHPVGQKAPNPFGLYDMLGNVWEWCADHWHGSYRGAPADGSAWLDADADGAANRVFRGGSWNDVARLVRAACRLHAHPALRVDSLGFRCARVQA